MTATEAREIQERMFAQIVLLDALLQNKRNSKRTRDELFANLNTATHAAILSAVYRARLRMKAT
jgi:hypothetical protein